MRRNQKRNRGFSLIELVIVVVIIGIIAAIAIPRMSRGASAARDGALTQDLNVLRSAIELYQAEHGGDFPPHATVAMHLTGYSKVDASAAQATKDIPNGFVYGPYIKAIPALPVGTNEGDATFADGGAGVPGAGANGWWYNEATGEVKANLPAGEQSDTGVDYNQF
jgi:prepilin-type N-terminal cleavage/methylation domain-containing protein